jgi:hypothetical protein
MIWKLLHAQTHTTLTNLFCPHILASTPRMERQSTWHVFTKLLVVQLKEFQQQLEEN